MSKIPSLCRLVSMLTSKRKIKELILLLELSLVVVLYIVSFAPLSNAFYLCHGIKNALSGENVIYCTAKEGSIFTADVISVGSADTDCLTPVLEEIEALGVRSPEVIATESHYFSYEIKASDDSADAASVQGYFIALSPDWYENVTLSLKKGELTLSDGSEYTDVVISKGFSDAYGYDVGDIINADIDGDEYNCRVTGIAKSNATIVDINVSYEETINAGSVGFNMAYYGESTYFMFAVEESLLSLDTAESFALLFLDETDTDELATALADKFGETMDFATFDTLFQNTYDAELSEFGGGTLMIVLLTIAVIFNFIGYIVINTREKQRVLSILNICGLSFRKSVLINALSYFMIGVPALLLGIVGAPYILEYNDTVYYGFNIFIGAVLIAIFAGFIAAAVLASILQRGNSDVINLYKKG